MMTSIPIAEAVSAFRSNEDSKDRILFTLQIAVKQIQHYSSIQGIENSLTFDVHEVRQLCDSLDKALLHGLRSCQKGYWPFVKEFSHSNTVSYLEELGNAHTDLQYGRFWLCLALSESSLESYFRSFLQNMQLVRKHYESLAIMRDEQKMQLILMLVSGLEYVPINLDVEKIECGSGISMFGIRSFESSSGSFIELSKYFSPRTTSQSSTTDYDISPCDNALEITSDFTTQFSAEPLKQYLNQSTVVKPKSLDIDLSNKVSNQDLERITYFINIDTQKDIDTNKQLEVVRTKVVRRTKRSNCRKSLSEEKISQSPRSSSPSPESKTQSLDESNACAENRLSKATTDSGLCLETPCSSDSESPDSNCDHTETRSGRQTLFEIGDFQRDFTVTFSTPVKSGFKKMNIDFSSSGDESCLEERGLPEGQEDPSNDVCSSNDVTNHLPLQLSSDECEVEDEEISIYDMNKMPYFMEKGDTLIVNRSSNSKSSDSTVTDLTNQSSVDPEMISFVSDELDCLLISKQEEVDLRVGNNVLLYLLVEVYEHEEESFHKLYLLYSSFPEGSCQRVYLLLTNKCIYILKQGNDQQKFFKWHCVQYRSIDYIIVSLNYQGFRIVSKVKEKFLLHTADEDLTRTIISNLELTIRRFIPKLYLPTSFSDVTSPTVFTDATTQTIVLKKFLASQLKCEISDIVLQHYVLARWQDTSSTSNSVTPSGPVYQDFLMYRHKFAKENKSTSWQPAFFLLKGGVLYCMEDEKSKPIFFIQMWAPHCKGCRRIHLLNRPHTFEIIRSDSDSLQLAASDEIEASNWLQCFLQTVSLAGHFIDIDQEDQLPCSILISNDQLVLAKEILQSNELKCLAKTNLNDLVSIFTDAVATNFVMMEFEVAEAVKSIGDWMFFFESQLERDKFLDCVRERWKTLFQFDLQIEKVYDLFLRKKYRRTAEQLNIEKQALHEFCYDN